MYALPHYDKGDWNCICDVCGRQFKASQLQLRWDGVMVCEGDWEPRQPQDFIRGVPDYQAPKWTRPEQSDQFVLTGYPNAIAGIGVAGLAIAANTVYYPLNP